MSTFFGGSETLGPLTWCGRSMQQSSHKLAFTSTALTEHRINSSQIECHPECKSRPSFLASFGLPIRRTGKRDPDSKWGQRLQSCGLSANATKARRRALLGCRKAAKLSSFPAGVLGDNVLLADRQGLWAGPGSRSFQNLSVSQSRALRSE